VDLGIAKAQVQLQFVQKFKINDIINYPEQLNFSQEENIERHNLFNSSLRENNYLLTRSFTTLIDETIEKYSYKFSVDEYFPKDQYLYRVASVKKGAYVNDINPGDVIIDSANWSTSPADSSVVLYRYSNKGMFASKVFFYDVEVEEVLFIIERNSSLKAIDISGYKATRELDHKSSGEILIKSHTPFRVLAIQDHTQANERGVIVLRPESLSNIDLSSDNIKSSFNGEIAFNILNVFTEISDFSELEDQMANFRLPAVSEEDVPGSSFEVPVEAHAPYDAVGPLSDDNPFTDNLISFNNPDFDPNHFNLDEGAVGGVSLEELGTFGSFGFPEEPFIE